MSTIGSNLGNRKPAVCRPGQGQLGTVKGDSLEERSMRQRNRRRPPISIPPRSQNDPSEICGISHRDPINCSGISQRDPMGLVGSRGISIAKSFRSWDRVENGPIRSSRQRSVSSSRAAPTQPIPRRSGCVYPLVPSGFSMRMPWHMPAYRCVWLGVFEFAGLGRWIALSWLRSN
jgi:hypothetical protein